jgi:adenine-specific DNA-methyltransferase
LYFSDENALKCDSIRQKIESWKKDNYINEDEYFFLLASLLEAIDKVANTASVYGAFLKELKKSAQKTMVVKPADFFIGDKLYKQEHNVFNKDINDLILQSSHDVVYLDPPYNERQYSANYHLLETIALYDEPNIK